MTVCGSSLDLFSATEGCLCCVKPIGSWESCMLRRMITAWRRCFGSVCSHSPLEKIVFRGDSGFCRWRMCRWMEKNQVEYVVGKGLDMGHRTTGTPPGRTLALKGTRLAQAEHRTLRSKLLKIGQNIKKIPLSGRLALRLGVFA